MSEKQNRKEQTYKLAAVLLDRANRAIVLTDYQGQMLIGSVEHARQLVKDIEKEIRELEE